MVVPWILFPLGHVVNLLSIGIDLEKDFNHHDVVFGLLKSCDIEKRELSTTP